MQEKHRIKFMLTEFPRKRIDIKKGKYDIFTILYVNHDNMRHLCISNNAITDRIETQPIKTTYAYCQFPGGKYKTKLNLNCKFNILAAIKK